MGFLFQFYLTFTIGAAVVGAMMFVLGIRILGNYLVVLNKLARFEEYREEVEERIKYLSQASSIL